MKYKDDGTVDRFKAILVVTGYTQTYGIDYTDIFTCSQNPHSPSLIILSGKF